MSQISILLKALINRKNLHVLLGFFFLIHFSSCTKDELDQKESLTDQGEKSIFVYGNDTLLYQFRQPESIESGKKYPVVLFLHGAFQRGNDNESQMQDVPPLLLPQNGGKYYPCFILAPQVPVNEQWVNVDWHDSSEIMPSTISNVEMLTMKLLDSLKNNISIDTNRIYVTGVSMGGFGTWDLICRFPQKFAAAVPVAGGGDENQSAQLASIPIWAFHGDEDEVIYPFRSVNMVNAVNSSGGNAHLTIYQNVGHWGWDFTYMNEQFYNWMFSQTR